MNWCDYLAEPEKHDEDEAFKATVKTGRPLGSERFVEKLEVVLIGLLSQKIHTKEKSNVS